MTDPVVTVDSSGRVVDCNAAARSSFNIGSDWENMDAAAFFEPLPDHLCKRVSNGEMITEEEVNLTVENQPKYFILQSQPLDAENGEVLGWAVLLRDVTAQKRREKELDLMRQVQSRVLRHNIRNRLTAVEGNAELLATEVEGEAEQRAQNVIDAADDLQSTSKKARYVEEIVESNSEPERLELNATVKNILAPIQREFPDVEFNYKIETAIDISAPPAIEIALKNLIENAAEHNTGEEQIVNIKAKTQKQEVVITVEDNGPGIPDHELSVIDKGKETKLDHGSGIGLWLISWAVKHSAATINYRTTKRGTDAIVRVPTAES